MICLKFKFFTISTVLFSEFSKSTVKYSILINMFPFMRCLKIDHSRDIKKKAGKQEEGKKYNELTVL